MPRRSEKPAEERREESLGAATRMLAEATAALTAALKQEASGVVPEVREVLASGLRDAAQGIADASASVAGTGARRSRGRRQSKVDHTRTELLAGAARVFEEKGYEGASVGDIAAAAGFTKGAVYANFPSKADVFVDLAKEIFAAQASQPCIPGLAEATPGPSREAVIADWLRGVEGQPGMLLGLEILSYALRHPESGEVFRPYYESAFADLARQIAVVRQVPTGVSVDPALVEPDASDWERALVVMSLSNIVPLFFGILGSEHVTPESAAAIIERLLTQ
jgi:AcrR family transcriptional regulator